MRDDRPLGRDTLASMLGHIVINWNELEAMVQAFVYQLAVYHSDYFDEDETFHVMFVMLSNSNVRSNCATAKALAFDVKDKRFYEKAEKVLSRIDNDLRNERNRCVHDIWQVGGNTTRRLKQGVSVRKAPSSGERSLEMHTVREYASKQDLQQLLWDIEDAHEELDQLNGRLVVLTQALGRPEE